MTSPEHTELPATDAPTVALTRRSVLRIAGAVGLAAPIAAAVPAVPAQAYERRSNVLFTDGFDTGAFGNWDAVAIDGNGTATVVPSPTNPHQRVARFTLPNDGVSYRSELALDQFTFGPTYRYKVSIYLPSDWIDFDEAIVSQWHGYPLADGTSTYPCIALAAFEDGYWRLQLSRLKTSTTAVKAQLPLTRLAPSKGRWTDWELDVTWSTPEVDGLLVLRQDGEEVFRMVGVNNYQQQWPPHFQMGLYRSDWRPGNTLPTGGPDVVIYHRSVSIETINTHHK